MQVLLKPSTATDLENELDFECAKSASAGHGCIHVIRISKQDTFAICTFSRFNIKSKGTNVLATTNLKNRF